jgi:GNAT superfamily N-acetyltransferase
VAQVRWELGVASASIVRASPEDVADAAEVLQDAARWVASLGFPAWDEGTFTDPEGRGRRQLGEAMAMGGLFVARIGAQAVGTVSLFDVDERFWPGAPRDALYVHKLAVRRGYAGRDIGGAILRWAEAQARSAGKRYLRLDCPRDDPGVRAYYHRAGFVHRGDVTVGTFEASLYELDPDDAWPRPAAPIAKRP